MKKSYILSVSAAVLLAACAAMPTGYHPQTSLNGDGYRDTAIEGDRYHVDFRGNIDTPRSLVEEYLLYRAAEITVTSGHDFFYVTDSATDTRTRYDGYADPDFGFAGGYGYPGWYGGTSFSETALNSYDASATILVGNGMRPNAASAYDAHDVLKTLGPQIIRLDPIP